MQGHDDIIVFGKFDNAIDANIVKSKLDAYGIPCFLTEENMANLYPGANALMNFNVRLHLFGYDAERAHQIVDEKNLRVVDDSAVACPACASNNILREFPKELLVNFFFILAIPVLWRLLSRKRCLVALIANVNFR